MITSTGRHKCGFYDLTMSVSTAANLALASQCPPVDSTPYMREVPKSITDSDLNNGEYKFDKMMKLHYPEDFKGYDKNAASAYANNKYAVAGAIQEAIIIELSNNFDLSASIEFEYDQSMYAVRLDELSRENPDDREDLTVVHSHLQTPLEFIKNDDKMRTVRRELIASDVDSRGSENKHMLTFRNIQPMILPTVEAALRDVFGEHQTACLFVRVTINIKSVGKSKSKMYSTRHQASGRPTLAAVTPALSPTFVHGRPRSITYDLVFTHMPHKKGTAKDLPLMEMRSLFVIKMQLINMKDGVTTPMSLSAAKLFYSDKHYMADADQHHVSAVFDLQDIHEEANTKIEHAQLNVAVDQLIDEENNQFEITEKLKKDGLPIYVFEDTDAEWTVKDEGGRVEQALEGTRLAREADREIKLDIGSRKSQLEKNIERKRVGKSESWGEDEDPDDATVEAKCLCVHGHCNEGSQECSGSCDEGFTGKYCDTPTASGEQLSAMRRGHGSADYKDGVYRPARISENTGSSSH